MKTVFSILIALYLSIAVVLAAPVFIQFNSNDKDIIYGPNNNKISFNVTMSKKILNVTANITTVELNGTELVNAINNNDFTYTIEFLVGVFSTDGIKSVKVIAFDPLDNSSNSSIFSVIIDSGAPSVTNQVKSPPVVFNVTNATLNATITDLNGLNLVRITGNWEGNFTNYTTIRNKSSVYYYEVDSIFLEDGEVINWFYSAYDKANNFVQGSLQTFTVTKRTEKILIPSGPDGLNGWYVTIPVITLVPDINRTALYRWDSLITIVYTGPFNFSDIFFGGLEVLTHFSKDAFNHFEPEISQLIKVDFHKPALKDLIPKNNSKINIPTPNISVEIDDEYQGNSGVNISSIIFKVDNVDVTNLININLVNLLKTLISYVSAPLSNGSHSVYIEVSDYAGNFNFISWNFTVDTTLFSINFTSPLNGTVYTNRRVPLSMNASHLIDFFYNLDNNRETPLCRDCLFYNRSKTFTEGLHTIFLKALDEFGNIINDTVEIEIETKAPVIRKTEPKKGSFIQGTNFNVYYREENLKEIILELNLIDNLSIINVSKTDCPKGRNEVCTIPVNLSFYNGDLNYTFILKDSIFTTISKPINLVVDNINPNLTITSPLPTNYLGGRVPLSVNLSEMVERLEYSLDEGPFKRLCSRCNVYNRTKTFSDGDHILLVRATDFAANQFNDSVFFSIE